MVVVWIRTPLVLTLAVAAVGCRFAPAGDADPAGTTGDGPGPGPDGGARADAPGDDPDAAVAPADARPPVCPPGNGLQLCLTFDRLAPGPAPLTLLDESSAMETVTVTSASVVADPDRNGQALGLTGLSRVVTSDLTPLGPTASVETWVRIDQEPPPGQRVGVLDDSADYSLFYYHDAPAAGGRRWRCAIGPSFFGPTDSATVGVWTHLACVCDQGAATLYVNGTAVATSTCDPVDTGRPVALGADRAGDGTTTDYLTGRLDDLRLWSRALTPDEVCAASGRSTCP